LCGSLSLGSACPDPQPPPGGKGGSPQEKINHYAYIPPLFLLVHLPNHLAIQPSCPTTWNYYFIGKNVETKQKI
jgi:hypothetical protein